MLALALLALALLALASRAAVAAFYSTTCCKLHQCKCTFTLNKYLNKVCLKVNLHLRFCWTFFAVCVL